SSPALPSMLRIPRGPRYARTHVPPCLRKAFGFGPIDSNLTDWRNGRCCRMEEEAPRHRQASSRRRLLGDRTRSSGSSKQKRRP
uniref:Uncharacterized protein n=1 Tax=Aegilops tauschii subsp. strangulata TaxID=200361 RepID=A0A453MP15_AEGTS